MATLTVGSDKQFATVSAAIAASQDGDVIAVDAGTYTNDFAHITTDITLTAIGGMVNMVATVPPPDGKAIFTTDGDITINGFSFSGAAVPDQNGAGIRMQTGDLTLTNCYFHHNENGVLTASDPASDLIVDKCEFAFNGNGVGNTHNLYVGAINSVTITDSYFHDAAVGHEIKSRALNTTVLDSRIQDESGSASYSIDCPNGGNVLIQGNIIEQGPNTQNPIIIAVGEEGGIYGNTYVLVKDNRIVDNHDSGSDLAVWNATGTTAIIYNNSFYGDMTVASGPNAQIDNKFLEPKPTLNERHPFDQFLTGTAVADRLEGGPGNDIFDGLAGNDFIGGCDGDDKINAGDGDDRIVGGRGRDAIISGSGNDKLVYHNIIVDDVDEIFDFSSVNDKFLLSSAGSFSAAGPIGILAASAFHAGPAAHDADDRIIYDSATGALRYDSDGTGASSAIHFATLDPFLTLTNTNFKII